MKKQLIGSLSAVARDGDKGFQKRGCGCRRRGAGAPLAGRRAGTSRCLGDESKERKKRPGGQSTQLAKGVERMPSVMQERFVQRGASAIIALDAFRAC